MTLESLTEFHAGPVGESNHAMPENSDAPLASSPGDWIDDYWRDAARGTGSLRVTGAQLERLAYGLRGVTTALRTDFDRRMDELASGRAAGTMSNNTVAQLFAAADALSTLLDHGFEDLREAIAQDLSPSNRGHR